MAGKNLSARVNLAVLVIAASAVLTASAAPPSDPFASAKWEMFRRTSTDGHLVYIRGNVALRDVPDRRRYAYRAGFVVMVQNPDRNGLPGSEEGRRLAMVEDEIDRAMSTPRLAFMALVITTDAMREYVFYTDKPDAIALRTASGLSV